MKSLVGLGRLELPTSPLSGVRSSHLSYRPNGRDFIISESMRPAALSSAALIVSLLQPTNRCLRENL